MYSEVTAKNVLDTSTASSVVSPNNCMRRYTIELPLFITRSVGGADFYAFNLIKVRLSKHRCYIARQDVRIMVIGLILNTNLLLTLVTWSMRGQLTR